jgi:predicted phage terminase large subunit-like protein
MLGRQIGNLEQRKPAGLPPPLLEWIPQVSPYLSSPQHLHQLTALVERSLTEPVRAVVSTPPQHTKTTTLLHGMAWLLRHRPERTNAYVSYATDFARSKSRQARRFAQDGRVDLDGEVDRLEEWRTSQGGGMLATGIGGPLTGQGINGLLLIDDPIKNRQEAESVVYRSRHWEWFNDVAYTRLHPQASAIVCMTRWHPDDLAGRLIKQGWEYVNLPAINLAGQALWPARYSVEVLEGIRAQVGEYTWGSLYMGSPKPRGGTLFSREPTYYDALPTDGYRQARGFDLAYSRRTRADYSVIVSGRYADGILYIEDVWRNQVETPVFATAAKLGQGSMYIYIGSTESGTIQLLKTDHKLPIISKNAVDGGDKFVRAQSVVAAWNAGRVRLPRVGGWLEAFLAELMYFTGINDAHDDQVDSLAALWDGLSKTNSFGVRGEIL